MQDSVTVFFCINFALCTLRHTQAMTKNKTFAPNP